MKKLFSFMICAVFAMAAGCKNFNHGKSNNSNKGAENGKMDFL
jgi:hypothetical protein